MQRNTMKVLTKSNEEMADFSAEAMEEVLEEQAEETLAFLSSTAPTSEVDTQPELLLEEQEEPITTFYEDEVGEPVITATGQTFKISAADIEAIEREAEEAERLEAEEIARAVAIERQREEDMVAARKLVAQKDAAAKHAEEERQEALARSAAVEEQRKADMVVARELAAQKKADDAALAVLNSSASAAAASTKVPTPPKEHKVPTSLQKKNESSSSLLKSLFGVVRQRVLPLVFVSFMVAAFTKFIRFYVVGSVV